MCMECDGWSRSEILDDIRGHVDQFGWSVVAVDGGPGQAPFAYTVGLTEFAHAELLVSGLDPAEAGPMLNEWAGCVADGDRFHPGDVVDCDCGHRIALARITDPSHLDLAWELFSENLEAVSALQIVRSDHEGRFPGDPAHRPDAAGQQLFGRLPATVRRPSPHRARRRAAG